MIPTSELTEGEDGDRLFEEHFKDLLSRGGMLR